LQTVAQCAEDGRRCLAAHIWPRILHLELRAQIAPTDVIVLTASNNPARGDGKALRPPRLPGN
jgi:hypothetical protein